MPATKKNRMMIAAEGWAMLTFQLMGAALLALFFGPMLSGTRGQRR